MSMRSDRGVEQSHTSGRGLSGVDVADDDHVDVHLFFTAVKSKVSRSSTKPIM
jgi:hypothetical protein